MQKGVQDRFLMDFGSPLGIQMEPKGAQMEPKVATLCPQMDPSGHRVFRGAWKDAKMEPKGAQMEPKGAPVSPNGSFRAPCF